MTSHNFRFIALFILCMLFLILSGCGQKSDPNKIILWTGMNTDKELNMLRDLALEYEKTTGIKVDIIPIPFSDLQNKFQIAAPASQGPDLITGPQDWVGIFAVANLISPLEFFDKEKDNFAEVSIKGASYNNKLYAIPLTFEASALIYNKDLIPELPGTMEDLFEKARTLTEVSETTNLYTRYGFLIELKTFYAVFPLFSGEGAYIFETNENGDIDPTRGIGLANTGAINAGKLIYDLSEYGQYKLIPKDMGNDKVLSEFIEGKAAMIVYGPWAINELDKAVANKDVKLKNYGICPLPPFKNGDVPKPFVSILGIMLNKFSKNPDKAKDFMAFMNNKDNQVKIYEAMRRIPARKEALESDKVKSDDKIQGFYESAKNGVPLPNLPVMSSVWNPVDDALSLIIAKKHDNPEEYVKEQLNLAVKRIQNNVDRLLR